MSRLVRSDANKTSFLNFTSEPVAVVPGTPGAPAPATAANGGTTDVDTLSTRIIKYIPAEVIAFYLAADKLSLSSTNTHPTAVTKLIEQFNTTYPWAFGLTVFLIAFIGTSIYSYVQSDKGQVWKANALISTVAFVVWAYASQGSVFERAGVYYPEFASFFIVFFTFLSGLLVPGGQATHQDRKPDDPIVDDKG